MLGITASGSSRDLKRKIAVGTRVTPRPPHRSRRALLTHRAPALGI